MNWDKKKQLLLAGAGLIVLIGLLVWNNVQTKQTSFNSISDSSTGISFNMDNNFEPIPKEELALLNPGFNYGFRPAGDPHASCTVSQTALKGTGSLTGVQLRDGIMNEVKKVHPDVKLINPATATKPVKFGEAKGILLEMTYREGSSLIKRVEVLAIGKATQVIAYCQSLAADNQRYYDNFSVFFSSLKLVK